MREQFDSKIQSIKVNMELLIKLIYFCPISLPQSQISLIKELLAYGRFRKSGIFAIYCAALMIQEENPDCINNLWPIFSDNKVLQVIFDSIRDVDKKYKSLIALKNKVAHGNGGDLLEPYEQQNKQTSFLRNKLVRQEIEAQKELDDLILVRKSCLQVLIIVVEFLSNTVIKNGEVILEAKQKETDAKMKDKAPQPETQQLINTKITAVQHEKLTNLIYNQFDLLELIYFQVGSKIPQQNEKLSKVKTLAPEGSANNQVNQENQDTEIEQKYVPNAEEVKLGARAFASMPFSILKKKNIVIDCLEGE